MANTLIPIRVEFVKYIYIYIGYIYVYVCVCLCVCVYNNTLFSLLSALYRFFTVSDRIG